MSGLVIRRDRDVALKVGTGAGGLRLLARTDGLEFMRQKIGVNATVWLTPAHNPSAVEFFYVLSGLIEVNVDDRKERLEPGDLFYAMDIKEDVLIRALADSELFYFTNTPVFDELFGFHDDLQQLIDRINEKDHYTRQHSMNVMDYSVRIMEEMGLCASVLMDNIAVAALFHDVGKCFVPDEILKSGKLLRPGDFRYIMRHPVDSGRLLKSHYNERIVEIVRNHHERLDGSGYPNNLTAEDISIEARIVGLADAFDAMTTDRGYNNVKTMLDAATELYELNEQFDRSVAQALLRLVKTGALHEKKHGERTV